MLQEKEILAELPHDSLRELVPIDQRLRIEHLCIGSHLSISSHIGSIRSDGNGWVSGGGTEYSRHRKFDLGFAAVNTTNVPMRVQLVLSNVDNEGYAVESKYVWADVSPNEKRRVWANLDLNNRDEFRSYVIKEIGIAVTPLEGRPPYEASTTPNRNVRDLFAAHMGALRNNTLLDGLNMSMKTQKEVGVVLKKGFRAYLTYVKWAAMAMIVLLLLGAAGLLLIYLKQS